MKAREAITFLPVTQEVSLKAIHIWAECQLKGKPLSSPEKLDIDSIICAHWQVLNEKVQGRRVIIATINIRHLQEYADVNEWKKITI